MTSSAATSLSLLADAWAHSWRDCAPTLCNAPQTDFAPCMWHVSTLASTSSLNCTWRYEDDASDGAPILYADASTLPIPLALHVRAAPLTVRCAFNATTLERRFDLRTCDSLTRYDVYHPLHQGAFLEQTCATERGPHQACAGHIISWDSARTRYQNATRRPLECCNARGVLPAFSCHLNTTFEGLGVCQVAPFATYGLYDVHVLQISVDFAYAYPNIAIGFGGLLGLVALLGTLVWVVQLAALVVNDHDDTRRMETSYYYKELPA
ncbi:hypothetical protein SPRG_16818 [Saprolegnia parasitica CBS 223.65]|uniref:Uncharacterized protein n=1 Tax=Saprolegnia parasitica (strain CBS 223.65) TaxID=695850 RepID=A0A067BHD7_SAPPC|nr:hypothetical protein SPRG_16818 [Saprolegnia parasitica CBS 223.65]KDO17784.1 hypothetical protein SPRG_16818 [Saprolegnia parasitica CBS 223.65]|eukprot:XP_012211510.1 hypothetical protein SPRG_16818 [Saprolegnia parasitica CBS 223.65]